MIHLHGTIQIHDENLYEWEATNLGTITPLETTICRYECVVRGPIVGTEERFEILHNRTHGVPKLVAALLQRYYVTQRVLDVNVEVHAS